MLANARQATPLPIGDVLTTCRARHRVKAHAHSVRRSRQSVARKELQKRAKQEYLRTIHETADRVEGDQFVFELQPSSPRVRAELQESAQHAELNKQLAQQIPQLQSLQQLQGFLQQHGPSLNFLNVVTLVTHAAALQAAAPLPAAAASGQQHTAAQLAADAAAPAAVEQHALVHELCVLVLEHSSWFQPQHFAAAAVALSDLGVTDVEVWDNLTAAAQHKVGAFTFPQLAALLEALAAAGYTPYLSWVERTYRQAAKHLHAADAADAAVLLAAWGEMGYTPRDRPFMNLVKGSTRRAFDQAELSGPELVQLMHGVARMPRYAPNQGWLTAVAKASQQQLQELTPGAVVDLLMSFVALDFSPPEEWMDAALARLQQAMTELLSQQPSASTTSDTGSSNSSSGGSAAVPAALPQQQQQQQQLGMLFLPPFDLQRLEQEQQLMSPGLLQESFAEPAAIVSPGAQQLQPQQLQPQRPQPQQLRQPQQQLRPPVDAEELQELQALFAETQEDTPADEQHTPPGANALDAQEGSSFNSLPSELEQAMPRVRHLSSRGSSSSSGDALTLRYQLVQQQLSAEQLGVLCWCLGKLQYQPEQRWMQLLGQVLLLLCPGMSPEVLVDVVLGCVGTGYLPVGPLQALLLQQLQASIPRAGPEGLRRSCQALEAWEQGLQQYEQHPGALTVLQQQQQQRLDSPAAAAAPEQAAAAAAAWPFGSVLQPLLQHKQELAAAIVHRQGMVLTGTDTAQLADVLAYAAAASQTPSLDYMAAAVTRAVNKLQDGCPTPAVSTLLWALARMGFKPHPQLLHQLLAALQRGLHRLSTQDLAAVGWALCTLRHRPGNTWLSLYLKEVGAKAQYMSAQDLTDTLWALACFAAQPDREWLKLVVQAVGSKAASGALSQQNAAVVIWSLQQLGLQPDLVLPAAAAAAGQGGEGAAQQTAAQGGVHVAMQSLLQLVLQPA